jgi:4-diphosphocytidyl-2C-methyl-D-erythritol kinase
MRVHDVSGATETIEAAPAKINLALHVTGQRADGYHLLETLVAFAEAGDVIRIREADADSFSISGPFGDLLRAGDGGDNLVTRARDLLRDALVSTGQPARPVAIHLEKNLPVASGIGGGSADAAATLRGLLRHWHASIDPQRLASLALTLGADVPMCLESRSLVARGIGENIEAVTDLPELFLVLANPLKAVSTPEILRRLHRSGHQADGWIFSAKAETICNRPHRFCCRKSARSSSCCRRKAPPLCACPVRVRPVSGFFIPSRRLTKPKCRFERAGPAGIFRRRGQFDKRADRG